MNSPLPDSPCCPICSSFEVKFFFKVAAVPVFCNVLWPTREAALKAARGDIELGFCAHCGHIYNYAFDNSLLHYAPGYENALHFSPRFRQYAEVSATTLIHRHALRGKRIIDIGCGDGQFLNLLCEKGANEGLGLDPSFEPANGPSYERVSIVKDLYSEKYATFGATLICCRHVLEHIEEPKAFLTMILSTMRHGNPAVFFEVPNTNATLADMAIWDIIYEHCSFFTAPSLQGLFEACGYEVLEVESTFGGQYLCLSAKPSREPVRSAATRQTPVNDLALLVESFADRFAMKMRHWQEVLDQLASDGQRVALWGAGSKGVTLLNFLHAENQVGVVVDVNPRKIGQHIAGTGQEIVSPSELPLYNPDVAILTNSIYEQEIRSTLSDLGLAPKILLA